MEINTMLQSAPNIVYCFIIFAAKLVEVEISSLKTVMLVKNKRNLSTAMAFAEVLVWAFVISGIIGDLSSNIGWLLAYCFGYAAGYHIGSLLENKIALGTMDVCIITPAKNENAIRAYLTKEQLGFSLIHCEGAVEHNIKVDIILPRKQAKNLRKNLESICEGHIFVLNYEVQYMHGGYTTKGSKAMGC